MEAELEGTLKVLCQNLQTTLALLLVGLSDLKMASTKVDKYGRPYKIGKCISFIHFNICNSLLFVIS